MTVQVVTPDRQVVASENATFVLAHGIEGDIGIMANHAPTLIALGVGPLRIDEGSTKHYMVVDGGFLQVSRNQVIVLAEYAITPDQMSRDQAAAEVREAEASLGKTADETGAQSRLARARAVEAMHGLLQVG